MDFGFPVGDFVPHDILFLVVECVPVEHFVGAVRVGDDQVDHFFVFAAPAVDDPGVVVVFVLDGLLHRGQRELLVLVVAVPAHLHSHRTDQAGVEHLQAVVLAVEQLALVDQLREGERGAGFSAADHGAVEDEGGPCEVSPFVEGALHCLDELDLAVVGLDVERGEELIVVGVVDQFGVLDDDCLVGVVVVLL